jgi:replicative DNA helicase
MAAAVLGSGERKSAVFADTVAPLEAAERGLLADARPVIGDAATRRRIAERRAQLAADQASKAGLADREALEAEACQAAAELDNLIVPAEPRLLADDATPEALTSLLAAQGGRIAIMSPEGGCFDIMAGRYANGAANFDVWLKGHAGDAIRVDRKGRPAEFVPHPALTMGLAVQPVVLRQIVGREGFRGRGLLARFLYAVPRSIIGRRMVEPPPVSEAVRDAYQHTITTLARSLADATEPLPVLVLDEPARTVLRGFTAELEARVGDDGDLGHIRDWAGKLAGAVVRIAGLLHVVRNLSDGWNRPIAEPTVTAAIRLGRYFTAHAVAAFDLMNADPTVRGARLTLRWIRERDEPFAQFSQRDAHRALRAHFEKVDDLKPALALLEACRYIRRQPRRAGRGRPSLTYDVNPLPEE